MTGANVDASRPRSRKPLIIMLVIAVLPMAGAYFVYFTGILMPQNTVNAGYFISPALSLKNLVSEVEWREFEENKKWRLLLIVPANCEEACEKNLYTSRQVHIRLDQKSQRLERLALLSSGISKADKEALLDAHPRLQVLKKSLEDAGLWLEELSLPVELAENYYLLVDQEGRAMMAYDPSQHGNNVLKDLKRAIKFSIDYQ